MNTYIALLRGINIGGHRKIKMVDLKAMLENFNFSNVQTYIQSGNVIFMTTETDISKLEDTIKDTIQSSFGFEVPVLVKTKTEIAKILKDSPYTKTEDLEANKIYYVLLKNEPEKDFLGNLNQEDYPFELFEISKNCVYLNCKLGAGKAKLTNNIIERKLKVSATTRNHRTMLKLLEMSQEH